MDVFFHSFWAKRFPRLGTRFGARFALGKVDAGRGALTETGLVMWKFH